MNGETIHSELSQEEDRIPRRRVLLVFGVAGLLGILLTVWAWYALKHSERAVRPSMVFPERELGPRRSVSQVLENLYGEVGPGQALNERKRRQLSSFEWVDRQRRIVDIPVEEAMNLLVQGAPR